MSNFPFISDDILQSNLDTTFEHILELLTLSVSENYKNQKTLVSSFRKTIIIYTATIIEALLLWKLKLSCQTQRIELPDDWKYTEIKVLHKISDSEEIIASKRKKETVNIDRLDFIKTTRLCEKHTIINGRLAREVDKVRDLRNRLHIGNLNELEREYSKQDLDFCFKIAAQVKKAVSL